MEKYFAGEKFTEEELYHGLHAAARTGHVYPVYVGSGLMNWGIRSTMDHLIDIMPTAAEADEVKAETTDGQTLSSSQTKTPPWPRLSLKRSPTLSSAASRCSASTVAA